MFSRTPYKIAQGTLLGSYLTFALFPFYWMLVTSLKRNRDLYNPDAFPLWFNEAPTLEHYSLLIKETLFLRWTINTAVVALGVVLITVLTAVLGGYSLARCRYRAAPSLGTAIFLTYLVPPTLLFIPLSQVIAGLGVLNSLWSLILSYPTLTVPFATWLMAGLFRTIPRELEEAAWIDGCTRFAAMLRILLPLTAPGLVTISIFAFNQVLQEYLYALTFINSSTLKTVPIGLTTDLIRGDVFYWGSLMAASVVASLPVVIVYSLFLRHYVEGLTGGAVR
jgi:multiple sugar transport system permease protein